MIGPLGSYSHSFQENRSATKVRRRDAEQTQQQPARRKLVKRSSLEARAGGRLKIQGVLNNAISGKEQKGDNM